MNPYETQFRKTADEGSDKQLLVTGIRWIPGGSLDGWPVVE